MKITWLILNHADAWVTSLLIGALSLALHGNLNIGTLPIPFVLAFGAWFAFAVNDRFDAPYDAHEPAKARRNWFVRRWEQNMGALPAHPRKGLASLDPLLAVCLVILVLMFGSFGARGWLTLLAGLAAAFAYSAPPLRLKTRPGFDLFTHAVFVETYPYLAAIALAGNQLTWLDALMWVIFALASLSAQLEQQTRDFGVDSRLERNFTTTFGLGVNTVLLRITSATLIGVGVIGVLTGVLPPLLWPGLLIALPLIAHRLIRPPHTPRSETLTRVLVAFAAVYAVGLIVWSMV